MKKFQFNTRNRLALAILGFASILLISSSANAQSITDGSTPLALSPGAPAGSYSLSDFDSVNPYNGNLGFSLPLVKVGGRGGAAYTMSARIEQKWLVDKEPRQGQPNLYTPSPNWWNNEGFRPIYSGGRMDLRQAGTNEYSSLPPCTGQVHNYTLSRLTFTAPDGTEYELRDQLTNGQPKQPTSCDGFNRGRVFITADGSSATFTSDADILDYNYDNPGNFPPSGDLAMRDGTHYRIDGGVVSWMRDRNGNKVLFTYDGNQRVTSITDSLNRKTTVIYGSPTDGYDQIIVKGFGGATRTIKVYHSYLQNALRSDFSLQSFQQLFPELNGAYSNPNNPPVISAIELPNGQQYQLSYNSYGELARVVLPTGGAIEYDYAAGLTDGVSGVLANVYGGDKHVYRRVVERRIYPDGGSGAGYASRMTYSRPESSTSNAGYVVVDQYNSSGTLLGRSSHYFYGSARASFNQQPTQYPGWKDGREYQTTVFAANGTTPLRQVTNTFAQRAAVSWWSGDAELAPPNDTRLIETRTTLMDTNQVSKQTFGYDDSVPFNNQNNVKEYDFGSGTPGGLVRESRTTFVTSGSYTGTGVSLLSLPLQTSVYDGAGVERARATFEYDNYNPDANHAGLITRAQISGLCDGTLQNCPNGPNFTNSNYIQRGNATATTRYLLVNGSVTGSVTSYAQYDIAGNVVKVIDARGNATTLGYSDRFGSPDADARSNSGAAELAGQYSYAFPTLVTNTLGHTAYTQFDYYLGRSVDSEDANGIVSSGYYNDVLDRPTQMIRAANQGTGIKSQSAFSYDDANHIVTSTSDQSSYGDNLLKSQTVYDGFGRTTEKRQYESPTAYITVRQTYDALGRAYQTSNPFRSGETVVWTTAAYDALSRVTSVTTPDSAVVATTYSGNTVTVADQTGKARKSVTDGLGRLIQVYEDPAGLNYLTSYSYDTLDNLITVSQGSQTRYFMYDSLKRLIRARNPEQNVNGSLTLSDPATGNSQWVIAYGYDNNGNLLNKTDARNVVSTYVYDSLNRVTTRSYSDGTPTVSYFYDAQTLPSGAPSYTRGYSTGRLVATTYGASSSTGDYYGFDAAGRGILKIQRTGAVNYQTNAAYNLAGAMTTETYPSGHTVTNTYDQAGRTTSLAGNLGDGTTRTYSTGIIYSSLGGMAKEQFGTTTPIYNKLFYNVRGQLAEIRESTSYTGPTDTTWDRGAIINHYSNTCWGMCTGHTMTDNNGNLQKQDVYNPDGTLFTQFYGYDALNRLQKAKESLNGAPVNWQQQYIYDRYGNRTIDQANTYGTGIPKPNFGVDTNTNRLTAPAGSTMSYDAAGNLTNDTFTGEGTRTYDAENKMKQAWANNQWQTYTYDGDGKRIKRNVNGTETWAVYGLGGELVAEYAANTAASSPQKEYGYRNGQLLIVATGSSASSYSLSASPATVSTGGNITVNWTAPSGHSTTDWVGLYSVGAADTTILSWQYVSSATSGSLSFTAPATAGTYEFRYFLNNGYTKVATSNTVTVGSGGGGGSSSAQIQWLVTDQLGTPRMVFDQTGSLATVSRHDYLPFGEELFAGTGGRTQAQGYTLSDNVRQKFTQKERDNETGLDYFLARYYGSTQGRFTSVDPLIASARVISPQSWNRYAYALNSPLRFVDPSGMSGDEPKAHQCTPTSPCERTTTDEAASRPPMVVEHVTVNVPDTPIQTNETPMVTALSPSVGPSSGSGQPSSPTSTSGLTFGLDLSGFAGFGLGTRDLDIIDLTTDTGIYTSQYGGMGSAGSFGMVSRPLFGSPSGYPSTDAWGLGVAGALGPGVFVSNAQQFDPDFRGDFDNTALVLGVVMIKTSEGGGTRVMSLSPAWGAGLFRYKTKTFGVIDIPVNEPLNKY